MRYLYVIISYDSKNYFPNNIDICPELEDKYLDYGIMIDFLENTLSILNKNKNISKELKQEMIYSIAALFFSNIDNLNSFLYEEKFINIVAEMTQNPELNIHLDKYEKNFFSYIKEQLLKVKDNKDLKNHLSIYIENKDRDLEINNLRNDSENPDIVSKINDLESQLNTKITEINNLQQTINCYKWLYLFAIIPVLGWIFCAILYFYFHKPDLNILEQLIQDKQLCTDDLDPLLTAQTNIFSRLNQLMRTKINSREQSEQLKQDC